MIGNCYATGLVKPKTTSVLFDKIVITDDLLDDKYEQLGYAYIPSEVLFPPRVNFHHDIGHFILDLGSCKEDIGEKDLSRDFDKYKYSMHRNKRIQELIEVYQRIGIHVVPIYFSQTEFERNIIGKNHKMKSPAVSICINNIPEIAEEKLDWEQVLEIRKDKESIEKIRRFRNWINVDLLDKSESEIRGILEKAIDDYKFSLKKHGIKTITGAISTVSAISVSYLNSVSKNDSFISLEAGLPIIAGIVVYTINSYIDMMETKRNPVAIIYDIIK